jgi:hypothetical protein
MNESNAELWTYAEAARFLRITTQTLRKKVSLHQVPVLKPFGRKGRALFAPDDLRAMVEASRQPADPVKARVRG